MALIECTECKSKVSSKAKECPNCGAPVKKSKNKVNKKRAGCGCLLMLIILVIVIIATISGDKDTKPVVRKTLPARPVRTPPARPVRTPRSNVVTKEKAAASDIKYEILDQDKSDVPIKTQLELHLLVSGNITEDGLRGLLKDLYRQARSAGGYKYHGGKPTHVFILLYTSRAHYESIPWQWVACLSKVGEDSDVDIEVRPELISQLTAKPEIKFGLTESERKEAYRAIAQIDTRAVDESLRMYPDMDPLDPGYTEAKMSARLEKQSVAFEELLNKYYKEITEKYKISEEQLWEIADEGSVKYWPTP